MMTLLFGAFLLLLVALGCYYLYHHQRKAVQNPSDYVPVNGVLQHLQLVEQSLPSEPGQHTARPRSAWALDGSYRYQVNGRNYISTQIFSHGRQVMPKEYDRCPAPEAFQSLMQNYRQGDQVTVYHAADDPTRSYLVYASSEPYGHWLGWVSVSCSLLALAAAFYLLRLALA